MRFRSLLVANALGANFDVSAIAAIALDHDDIDAPSFRRTRTAHGDPRCVA